MDYCYSCRRHLNGALSCPGCGTPVDQLALPVEPAPAAGVPAAPPEPDAAGGRAARRRPPKRRGGKRLLTGAGVGLVLIVCTAAALATGTFANGPEADTGPTRAPATGAVPQASESSPAPRHTTARPTRSAPATTASTSGTPSGSPTATPTATRRPTRSATPTTRPPTEPTNSPTPSPTKTPKPSHGPTCKPVLWWCE